MQRVFWLCLLTVSSSLIWVGDSHGWLFRHWRKGHSANVYTPRTGYYCSNCANIQPYMVRDTVNMSTHPESGACVGGRCQQYPIGEPIHDPGYSYEEIPDVGPEYHLPRNIAPESGPAPIYQQELVESLRTINASLQQIHDRLAELKQPRTPNIPKINDGLPDIPNPFAPVDKTLLEKMKQEKQYQQKQLQIQSKMLERLQAVQQEQGEQLKLLQSLQQTQNMSIKAMQELLEAKTPTTNTTNTRKNEPDFDIIPVLPPPKIGNN